MNAFAAILILALGPAPAQEDTGSLLKRLDSDDASERQAAFRDLKGGDARTLSRLKSSLKKLRDRWFRKCRTERERAVKALMKRPDSAALARDRDKALALLARGDTRAMKPVVKGMWKALYFDPEEADRRIAEIRDRVLEFQSRLDALGFREKKDYRQEIRRTFLDVDEKAVAGRMPPADQAVMRGNVSLARGLSLEERHVILLTNQYRVLMGKTALRINPKLCDAAREHSRDMKEHNFFSHDSPLPGKENCVKRAARHGTKCNSENLAKDATIEEAFWGWFGSVPHHRGMLGPWKQIGVGHHQTYWTQNF